MKFTIKPSKLLICIGLFAIASPVFADKVYKKVNISVRYTAEQVKLCQPVLQTKSAADAKKSAIGEKATATATAVVNAGKNRFLDVRPGAYAYEVGGLHVNTVGTPTVSKRHKGIYATQLLLKSRAHRGRSFRTGRNARVNVSLQAYEVNRSVECAVALGLFD